MGPIFQAKMYKLGGLLALQIMPKRQKQQGRPPEGLEGPASRRWTRGVGPPRSVSWSAR